MTEANDGNDAVVDRLSKVYQKGRKKNIRFIFCGQKPREMIEKEKERDRDGE